MPQSSSCVIERLVTHFLPSLKQIHFNFGTCKEIIRDNNISVWICVLYLTPPIICTAFGTHHGSKVPSSLVVMAWAIAAVT